MLLLVSHVSLFPTDGLYFEISYDILEGFSLGCKILSR